MAEPLLEVQDLHVRFRGEGADLLAVEGLSLQVGRGEVLGLVGESGSGKSVSMMAVMGLIDPPGEVQARRIALNGVELRSLPPRQRRRLLGSRLSMIFQDPAASLDPCYTIGSQLLETLAAHHGGPARAHRARALDLLSAAEVPDAAARMQTFPHQLSGGLCQRVMIALALAGEPELLIADEPTTALDVTIQAQIVDLLRRLQRERGLSLILISHDLALVSGVADRVVVMYAGQAMEAGPARATFANPAHPYTRALMQALPQDSRGQARLQALPGIVPGRTNRPAGCLLAPRCAQARAECHGRRPALRELTLAAPHTTPQAEGSGQELPRFVACHLADGPTATGSDPAGMGGGG
jgi:dipeptide transport system ATP-binding protein